MIEYKIDVNTMNVDGVETELESCPVIVNEAIMVPAESFVKAFGGEITEQPAYQAMVIACRNKTIIMRVGIPKITVNDVTIDISAAPYEQEGIIMIPLGDIAESLEVCIELADEKILVYEEKAMIGESIDKEAYDVAIDSEVTITFNLPPDLESLSCIQVTVGGGDGMPIGTSQKDVVGTWSITGLNAIFTPSENFEPQQLYEVLVHRDVKSIDGTKVGIKNEKRFVFITQEPLSYHVETVHIDNIDPSVGTILPMKMLIPETEKKLPVLFCVHGGGWQGGTADLAEIGEISMLEEYLTKHLGVAIIMLSYRCLGSEGTFKKGFDDVMAAVKYIQKIADTHNFDMDRIGFYGGSAGTPLASLAALKIPDVKAYFGISGIYNFEDNPNSIFPMTEDMYEINVPNRHDNSPIFNIGKALPKMLLLHGTDDKVINYRQSVLYKDAVNRAGGQAETVLFDKIGHEYTNGSETATLYFVKKFLKESLFQ